MKKCLFPLLIMLCMAFSMVTPAIAAVTDTGYSDVNAQTRYAEAVFYCRENRLMSGVSPTTFEPDAVVTRAMLATVLYRAAGEPATIGGNPFIDVVSGSWYESAVNWAAQSNLVKGYDNGYFGVNDPITHEQAIMVFWRYAGSPEAEFARDYADEHNITSYATTAVDWAKANQIIGDEEGIFDPQGRTYRGEWSMILMRSAQRKTETNVLELDTAPSDMVIEVQSGDNVVMFQLNDSAAAKGLYDQLELSISVENYSNNEKIFYPPQALDTSGAPLAEGGAGVLAYFAPWDDVVMFYGDFSANGSLFSLGHAIAGTENISKLTGDIEISKANYLEEPNPPQDTEAKGGQKVLVANFSATGTTKTVAEYVAEALDADMYAITPETTYTSADLNYNDSTSRSSMEQNNALARPVISGNVENIDDYDVVFLGYPIWWGQAPKIVHTFIESYDFAGKSMIPFCTSGGSGIGSSASNLEALCDDSANWLTGARLSGVTTKLDVIAWINELNLGFTAN